MKSTIKQKISEFLASNGLPADLPITTPPSLALGDYAVPMFALAKERQMAPPDVAAAVAEQLQAAVADNQLIAAVTAAGPYVNLTLRLEQYAQAVIGTSVEPQASTGKTVLVEFFNANPLKVMHVGHLLNAVMGESIRRLYQWSGYTAHGCSYSGDVGIHVAKWLWYFHTQTDGRLPTDGDFLEWAGHIYVKASQATADDPAAEAAAQEYNRRLAADDAELVADWQSVVERSYQSLHAMAETLDCQLEHHFRESQTAPIGIALVAAAEGQGIVTRDQGALVVDLEDEKLGVFLVLKTDGTALYSTKDIGLMIQKQEQFGTVDRSIVVVGVEQELHFRQLIATARRLELPNADCYQAVHHGLVDLKEGKMSSRTGMVQSAPAVVEKARAKVQAKMAERDAGLADDPATVDAVALGALKFSFLGTDRKKNVTFDWDSALSFEGASGPYVQYTYARIAAISKKAATALPTATADYQQLGDGAQAVLQQLAGFGEVMQQATEQQQPYLVAQYLLELSAATNSFYHHHKVIDPAAPAVSQARLALVQQVGQTIKQGLWVLGIEVVEEM